MFHILLTIAFIASCIAFALYGYDKHLATYQKFRIPEAVLIAVACIGGAFGAICGMWMFRHKTHKRLFTILVPVFLFLQLAGCIAVALIER